jgi:LmbE family N-acetylglucosaminyl deacetylase
MKLITRRQAGQVLVAPLAASLTQAQDARPPKVLLVVAHPDDEYYFAGTVYRLAQELNGTIDQVVITNGEAGYKYAALAERIYGVKLTDEATGRRQLPAIRRRETLAAGKILGIRHHHFFNERDHRFTLAADETLTGVWNCDSVRSRLRALLAAEQYDFVFTLLPRSSTHGHHQAATLLTLDVVAELEPARRPVVLGAEPGHRQVLTFTGLDHFAQTTPATAEPVLSFDRHQSFGHGDALRYDIVVQWVIAEHKSQGMFQNDAGKHDIEHFWRFALGPDDAVARTEALAHLLCRQPQAELRKAAHQ